MTEACDARTNAARNASGCLQKERTRCTFFTKARDVSYSDFGALVRECIK